MAKTRSEFRILTEKVIRFRDARDWKKFHNPKDIALSLVLEASEVLEHFQWKNDEETGKYLKTNKNRQLVAHELADVLWWLLILSDELEIDLDRSFLSKLHINERKYPVKKSRGNSKKYTELK